MSRLFYVQIHLHGQPADWQVHALHELMQTEGFSRRELRLIAPDFLSETSYFGRREGSEDSIRKSLRNRIAEAVWGDTLVSVLPLHA